MIQKLFGWTLSVCVVVAMMGGLTGCPETKKPAATDKKTEEKKEGDKKEADKKEADKKT